MKKIKIKNYEIGKNFPPFIIAEAGINHNGDLKKALQIVGKIFRDGHEEVSLHGGRIGKWR